MSMKSDAPAEKPRRFRLIFCTALLAVLGLAASGLVERAKSKQELAAWTEDQAIPTVRTVQPQRGPSEEQLSLPGNVKAYYTGSLYARASGYVTAWRKDIGARVKKGEVLAEIAAPDLDQQLVQAKAQLVQLKAQVEQARANADLGQLTDQRTSRLVAKGWSSAQQGDTDRLTAASRLAALDVAKANVEAQQAAVGRLEELTRFKQIVAPFDGVVTARNVDVGDLVNADGKSGKALFQVSDIHEMRIYVNVPQAFLGQMTPGLRASLDLPGQEQSFEATLVSTSNALSEDSRTSLAQLQAANPEGKLWPGAFAEVHFHIPSDQNTLHVPATALIFGSDGMNVAAVGADGRVELKKVGLGRNLGASVEIRSGVSLSDKIIDNPLEMIASGDVVRLAGADAAVATAREARAEARATAARSERMN